MTIAELYQWALENGVENFEIYIGYRDGGGTYCGSDPLNFGDIVPNFNNETVEF
jgi:hypothetical protein